MKTKVCKICKLPFEPTKPLQSVCSFGCALDLALKKRIKSESIAASNEKRKLKADKERIKTRQEWLKEAQQAVNAYIRTRDKDLPCISCGCGNIRYVSGQPKQTSWDAGHYRTTGSCPELRFNEFNIHKQCVHDNQHKHGDIINYRIGLIKRIGLEKVEWLEGKHEPAKWTIDELKSIKAEYKSKLKELINES